MNSIHLFLLVSLALNGVLGWVGLGQRDKAIATQSALRDVQNQRDDARAMAAACSQATHALKEQADQRTHMAASTRSAAASQASAHARRSDFTLGQAPSVPADQCISMQSLGDNWLKEWVKK